MYKLKYILYSGVRTYERFKDSNFVPSRGMLIRIGHFPVAPVVTKVVYDMDKDIDGSAPCIEVYIEQEDGIDLSRHFLLENSGWKAVGTDGLENRGRKSGFRIGGNFLR